MAVIVYDSNGNPHTIPGLSPGGSGFGGALGSAMGPATSAGGHLASGLSKLGGGLFGKRGSEFSEIDPQGNMAGQSGAAGAFADQAQGGYGAMTSELAKDRARLRRLQSGKDSVSAEQLRQGLQQNLAAQRSMAASAAPGNQAMAARTAAMQAGRVGSGLAGQQALAGIAERNAATQALAQMNLGQRGQDVNAALGSRGTSIQGYGALEQARTGRYSADLGVPTTGEQILGAGAGLAGMKLMSDRRLKTDIKGGEKGAEKLLKGLKAYSYRYKDAKHGEGEQLGIMAQDLERAGAGHAVVETPEGKAVHGGKLAAALAAALPGLDQRLSKLEGSRK